RLGHARYFSHGRIPETAFDEGQFDLWQIAQRAADAHPFARAAYAHAESKARELIDVGIGVELRVVLLEAVGELGDVAAEEPLRAPLGVREPRERGAELRRRE